MDKPDAQWLIEEHLKRVGEDSTANIGLEVFHSSKVMPTNPARYCRPAAKVLKMMEAEGIVKSRIRSGSSYIRTMWRLNDG